MSMTKITKEDIADLASLSSIMLSDDEIDSLATDISSILNYVEQLKELDTEEVEPTYQVASVENSWQDDVVDEDGISGEELLLLSPDSIDNQIKVPKVL